MPLPLLSNSQGLHTNAVYGVTTMLMKLLEDEKPTHFLFAFDAGKITFRHADYKDYKGGRAKTPPELSEHGRSSRNWWRHSALSNTSWKAMKRTILSAR